MESSGQVGGNSQNQKFIMEPDKFHLGGEKTPLVGVCYWRPLAHALTGSDHLLQPGQQHPGTENPFLPTGGPCLETWQGARLPHHVSCLSLPTTLPHTHLHSPISQTHQSSGPAGFSSALIQTSSPQVFAFSYTSLDLHHSNKKVNPGFFHQMKSSTKTLVLGTDTGMEEQGCPIPNASLTLSKGSFRLLQTLWSQLYQLWNLQTKIQTPRTLKD